MNQGQGQGVEYTGCGSDIPKHKTAISQNVKVHGAMEVVTLLYNESLSYMLCNLNFCCRELGNYTGFVRPDPTRL